MKARVFGSSPVLIVKRVCCHIGGHETNLEYWDTGHFFLYWDIASLKLRYRDFHEEFGIVAIHEEFGI